ncbi:MAG: thiamine phosphate synthase [Armatimonadota bacterium]|nr:thiamine phosphate synthase [Armatimonadota bacterium]MDR7445041.1 thiamine phosphate synthase [Armatimonadota bacterium]MDR7570127.1 thiamine phosphate synthase [Armatimonadota bacterium]MDR7614729.1 thiamine phosphate synthase [Armatimonadota bacterium]
MKPIPRLLLVTDRHLVGEERLVSVIRAAVRGGVEGVQVREKDLPDEALERLVHRILDAVEERAVVLLNDRPHLARRLGLGLHLPEASPPPQGNWPLWGRSVHSPEAAVRAARENPDYLIAGPVYPTDSKPGGLPLGREGLRAIVRAAGGIPVLAIGGIGAGRVREVVEAGTWGVAVRGAILRSEDPEHAAREIRRAVEEARKAVRPSR